MNPSKRILCRRTFLKYGIGAAGLLGIGGAVAMRLRHRPSPAAAQATAHPFAYELDAWRQTDPQLIHYEQIGQIRSPHADPRRIAIGPEDQLHIAAGKYVSILDRQGNAGTDIALAAEPRCLAVAADGTIFVGLRDHLEVYHHKGQRTAVWESPGRKTWFTGLAVGENDVFAADAGNRLVLRYDRSGKLIGRIGEKNQERNIPGFIVPSPFFDLEIARDGLLRVTNPGRHRVEAYTFNGDLEFAWGKASAAIDGFCGCCNPISLAMLSDGRYVTCEKGLPRVKVYGADGTFESVVAGSESFAENAKASAVETSDGAQGGLDAAVDSQGRVYVLDLVAGDVRIMRRKTGLTGASALELKGGIKPQHGCHA
ncbi:MAG: hypothetical protein AAB466_09580 [Verrucomicrobiota bacterium]